MIGGMRDGNIPSANIVGVKQSINYAKFRERLLIPGAVTATSAKVLQWTVDCDMIVEAFGVMFQATSGTMSTYTLDILDDDVSILDAAIDLSTPVVDTVFAGVIDTALQRIESGSVVTISITVSGGSSPSITNLTCNLLWRPPYGEEIFT